MVTRSVTGLSVFRGIERLGKSFRGPPEAAHQGVLVRRSQGAGQVRRRAWPAAGLRSAVVAGGRRLNVADLVPDRTRSRFAQHCGAESDQGSARHSAPAREHFRDMQEHQPRIQALPGSRWNLLAGLFQFRLPVIACTQRRFRRQGHRAAVCPVQCRLRRGRATHRQTGRYCRKNANDYARLPDLPVDEPWLRVRGHAVAGHRPIHHLRPVLCDR